MISAKALAAALLCSAVAACAPLTTGTIPSHSTWIQISDPAPSFWHAAAGNVLDVLASPSSTLVSLNPPLPALPIDRVESDEPRQSILGAIVIAILIGMVAKILTSQAFYQAVSALCQLIEQEEQDGQRHAV